MRQVDVLAGVNAFTHLLDNKGVMFILGFALVNLYEVLWHLLCQNLVTNFPAKIMVIKVNYFW